MAVNVRGQRFWIPDLAPYEVIDPIFEAVRIALHQRGDVYSPAYIQGISGSAFRIAGICPCAPTCNNAMWTHDLAKLLGYEVRTVNFEGDPPHYKATQTLASLYEQDKKIPALASIDDPTVRTLCEKLLEINQIVKSEIRAGHSVVLWHAFTNAECDVVAGFDDSDGLFLGRGSYAGTKGDYAVAPQGRSITTVHIGGMPNMMSIGEKIAELDAKAAEVAALKEAVRHAHQVPDSPKDDGWQMLEGIACYERWAKDFENPERKREMGDAYCLGVYGSTHSFAAPFLREIAPKYPVAVDVLESAAQHFDTEAQALKDAMPLLWWDAPAGPDAERNAKAAVILARARDAYASGITSLDSALALMD